MLFVLIYLVDWRVALCVRISRPFEDLVLSTRCRRMLAEIRRVRPHVFETAVANFVKDAF